MELKLDVKTLIIGMALGVILASVMGAGSADESDYGLAISDSGFALVRTASGAFYLVDAKNAKAERIEDRTRGSKNRYFNFDSSASEKTKEY